MARVHGFRIYVVQAFPTSKKGKEPLSVAATSTARDEILACLESLSDRGTRFIPPRPPADPSEPVKPTASITFGQPYVVRQDLIHVSVAVGETGSHDEATRRGKKPKKLKKWSPEAPHFITFAFPEGNSDRFVIIAQSIRRRDPVRRMIAAIRKESQIRRDDNKRLEDIERQELKAKGERLPKRKVHSRLVFDVRQAADNEYIAELLASATAATATFTSTAPSSRGSKAGQVERTLQIKLLDGPSRDIGRRVGRDWASSRRRGTKKTQADGVSELGDLMEHDHLLELDEHKRYEKASVNVRNKDGDSTTIAVDTLRDVFTYPVSDGAPPLGFYYTKVAHRLEIVAAEESINIRIIDPGEVEECVLD